MMSSKNACRWIVVSLALLIIPAAYALPGDAVQYELRFERPNTHLLSVTMTVRDLSGATADFAMPAWAPGAYRIMDYAKNVQEFNAASNDGKPLVWHKTDKHTWRVELGGAREAIIRYKVFGNTLLDSTVQYNEEHAHISGPALWMYVVNGKTWPVRLTTHAPTGWRVATGMERTGENSFASPDYDTFADAPLEMGEFAEKTFTVLGSTYHVIVHDKIGSRDFTRFTADLQKIVETIVPTYPASTPQHAAPYKEYWFLFHIAPGGLGGLEHLNSTQINLPSDWSSTVSTKLMGPGIARYGTDYNLKLFVAAHEFYHAWNVKRLRPRPLGPFDYTREANTPSLWISEGLTSYYGELAIERAGLEPPQAYLDSIAQLMTEFEAEPGRRERSIEDTSWDIWFSKSGQMETNLGHTTYSYYDGGQLAGHLLDFAIRQATNNQKSLDDCMRLLYSRYALPKPGFEPADAVRAASEVAGRDLSDFFRKYVSGKEPLPYETYFGYAGIRVEKKIDPNKAWMGVNVRRANEGRLRVADVLPGSPAEQAGLDEDDIITAMNGSAVNADNFYSALASVKPGDTVKFAVFRNGKQREIAVTMASDPHPVYALKPMENPNDLQKRIFRSWLGIS